VPTLNQATGTFKSNFTANLEKKDLFSIYTHLNAIRTILKDINEIVDSNFSNFIISVFPSILYQLFLDYAWKTDLETEAELGKYNSRGSIINSDPGYVGNPIQILETFLLDRAESIRNYFGNNLVEDEDTFSHFQDS
jgi:hypothetical protein